MASGGIGATLRRGLMWSTAGTVLLRGANLAVGIVVARLMTPDEFGVWAVALTIQTVLLTLADLGLSTDLVRSRDVEDKIPTVATIGLCAGAGLTVALAVSSSAIADVMNSPESAPVIVVMSFTMVLAGVGVVPFGLLQRRVQQKELFAVSATDMIVGSTVTIALILVGVGPMALAISRLVAQSTSTVLMFLLARVRPRFGFDRRQAFPALAFGVPVAGANLLSWALLNVDNVVIARMLGTTALGLYVLAFNVSTWPMTIIGQAVRSVSLAGFSHVQRAVADPGGLRRDPSLAVGVAVSWGAAVPAGVLLAALATPLVDLLYGDRWLAAAPVLAALGCFGVLRVLFDVVATYLMASGRSGQVFAVQAVWMLTLVPAVVLGVGQFGIPGAAYAHIATGVVVVAPIYAWLSHRAGADTQLAVGALVVPCLAGVPAWFVGSVAAAHVSSPALAVLLGGTGGLGVYVALVYRWALRQVRVGRDLDASLEPIGTR